jgi:tryptophanyl-tRNA synthetase
MNKKPKVFSGIQPSGNMHLGNYLGAILTWVREQDEKENIFCIVDEHAITVPQDPKILSARIMELAKVYLAAGIDPKKSHIFVQSSRPEHTELGWILNCFTYVGELNRMTQFKDKARNKGEAVTVGLYDYPALMAADILLYNTDQVPVGEDQKQHVELTRDIAVRMNKKFKKLFVVPEYYTVKEATRVMSLTDPTVKMSKSDENPNSRIEMLDKPEVIRKKFAKAVTDSEDEIKFDKENKPGISNLLNILAVVTKTPIKELEKKYQGVSYGQFKADVAEAVITLLAPFQTEYAKLNDDEVKKILKTGAQEVADVAAETLARVKKAVGLGI